MFLRFDSAIAGKYFSYSNGDIVEWPDDKEAQRLVDRGIAEQLTQERAEEVAKSSGRVPRKHRPAPVETATRRPGETMATR